MKDTFKVNINMTVEIDRKALEDEEFGGNMMRQTELQNWVRDWVASQILIGLSDKGVLKP